MDAIPVIFMIILFSGLIGVMPGCGGMIVVASAFLTVDNFPLSALITASIATREMEFSFASK